MSRHRNVRSMDYKEEYDGYDDVFGHSVDDEGCISPTDAQQWIYDRARGQQSIVNFMASNRDIQEEDEGRDDEEHEKERRDSESYQLPELPEEELARLLSCMDEIRSIVGDSVSEKRLVETIMHFQYDMTRALDSILNPAPQTAATASAKAPDKEASSAMEKDCDPLPKARESFNDLSELIKARLNSQPSGGSKKLSMPKLNTSRGSAGSSEAKTVAFTVPKLKMSQGSSEMKRIKFNLPKLKVSQESPKTLPTVQHPAKVEELRVAEMSLNDASTVDSNSGWIVDLTTALISCDDVSFDTAVIPDKEDPVEDDIFVPQFVDCDVEMNFLAQNVTQYCEIDLSHLLGQKLRQRSRKYSKIGSILCRKYKKNRIPNIPMRFERRHNIEPFNFATPSPDDYCLQFLRT